MHIKPIQSVNFDLQKQCPFNLMMFFIENFFCNLIAVQKFMFDLTVHISRPTNSGILLQNRKYENMNSERLAPLFTYNSITL